MSKILTVAQLTSKAGKAGTGASKRRSDEHYARLSPLGVAARLKKWQKKTGKTVLPKK